MALEPKRTVSEITKMAQVGSLKRLPGPAMSDPLREGIETAKLIAGQRIVQSAINQVESQGVQAENERLKAEIERKELLAKRDGRDDGKGKDSAVEYLYSELKDLRTRLEATQTELTNQQLGMMAEQIQALNNQLQAVINDKNSRPDEFAALTQKVQEAKSLLEILHPSDTPPPATGPSDAGLDAWKVRAQHAHEERMRELDMLAEERKEDRTLRKQQIDEELRLKGEHYQSLDRALNKTLPDLLGVAQNILTQFMQQRGAEGAIPAALAVEQGESSAAATPEARSLVIPPGAQVTQCGQCGVRLVYRDEYPSVICNGCGAEYALTDPESQGEAHGPATDSPEE